MLDHVVNRDGAGVVEAGRGARLAHRTGDQVGALIGRLRRQQYLLDRHHAVKELVMAAPHPSQAALADRLSQQVPAAYQHPRSTRHSRIIGIQDICVSRIRLDDVFL